ncbi:MAG: hypothetical protein Kow00105_13180 [Phycisphaeraceae bacterium]
MIEPAWVLWGLLLPAALGALTVWLCSFLERSRGEVSRWGQARMVLGLGVATACGMLAITGMPPWRPMQGPNWLLAGVLPVGMVVAWLCLISPIPRPVLHLMRFVVAMGVAPLLTYPLIPYTWTQTQAYVWWAGLGLGVWLIWWLMHRLCTAGRSRTALFVLGMTSAMLAGVTMASGYLAGGQLTATLAVVLGAGWVVMVLRRDTHCDGALIDLVVPLLYGMLVYHWHFGWTMQHPVSTHIVGIVLGLAPAGIGILSLMAGDGRKARRRVAIGMVVSACLWLVSAGLAGYEAYARVQASSEAGYYGY